MQVETCSNASNSDRWNWDNPLEVQSQGHTLSNSPLWYFCSEVVMFVISLDIAAVMLFRDTFNSSCVF